MIIEKRKRSLFIAVSGIIYIVAAGLICYFGPFGIHVKKEIYLDEAAEAVLMNGGYMRDGNDKRSFVLISKKTSLIAEERGPPFKEKITDEAEYLWQWNDIYDN